MIGSVIHVMGLDDPSGRWYLFWSGIFGDASILAVPLILWRKHDCHQRWCPRIARFPVTIDGARFLVCHKHHKTGPPTAQQVADAQE